MLAPAARRTLQTASALVTVPWALVVLGGPALPSGGDPISAALFLGIGALVPLGVTLLPPAPGPASPLVPLVPLVLVPSSILGATSLALGVGPAGGIAACAWTTGTIVLALIGLGRLARALRASERRATELGAAAALLSLPVGAVWLVMSRLGVDPMGASSLLVLSSAVHLHFAGFGLVTLVVLALERAPRARSALGAALAAIVVSIPLVVARGSGAPVVAQVGAWLLATGVVLYAGAALLAVRPTLESGPARVALALSCLAPLGSMPLAVLYVHEGVDLDLMVHAHGMLNAYGLVGLGLLAYALEARAVPVAGRSA